MRIKLERVLVDRLLAVAKDPLLVAKWLLRGLGFFLARHYFDRLLSDALDSGYALVKIQKAASLWYGPSSTRDHFFSSVYLDQVFLAHKRFARNPSHSKALGAVRIGLLDLKVPAFSGEENTARIFLLGYDESRCIFDVYRRLCSKGSIAIDVGANIGIHSAVMSLFVGVGGRVYAYEALAKYCLRMRETLEENQLTNVTVRTVACGAKPGYELFRAPQGSNIGTGQRSEFGESQVKVVALDDEGFSENIRVSLLKIDTEGMELEVLRGAQSLLSSHTPAIVLEYNPEFWSLRQLSDVIPFQFNLFELPLTANGKICKVGSFPLRTGCNLLILPVSKSAPQLFEI